MAFDSRQVELPVYGFCLSDRRHPVRLLVLLPTPTTRVMDSALELVLQKYQAQTVDNARAQIQEPNADANASHARDSDSDSESILELLESLENDDDVSARYREQRLAQLKKEMHRVDNAAAEYGDSLGAVHFVDTEKEAMDIVAKSDAALLHLYQPTFSKCRLMNEMLEQIAERHLAVTAVAITAETAPFLVSKLQVKVLPLVVAYKEGKEVGRVLGFEGLGSESKPLYQLLERRLHSVGVLSR